MGLFALMDIYIGDCLFTETGYRLDRHRHLGMEKWAKFRIRIASEK